MNNQNIAAGNGTERYGFAAAVQRNGCTGNSATKKGRLIVNR